MDETADGKELVLTRRAIEHASQQDRFAYGAVFAKLFEESGLQQKEVAARAGVTPRTIRNIIQGHVAPQAENLVALLTAVGVDLTEDENADVRSYTRMLAPIIRRVDPDHRHAAVSAAIDTLSDYVIDFPNDELARRRRERSDATRQSVHTEALGDASWDERKIAAESIRELHPDDTDDLYDA